MLKHERILTAFLMLSLLLTITATAEPVQWLGNGHYYELVTDLATWQEADVAANNRTYLGNPGYLATITSDAENNFIFWEIVGGNIDTPLGDPWLGGYQNSDQSEPAENWHWVTDEEWTWTSWAPGEPNDYDQTYAEMYLNYQLWGDAGWNDHHSLVSKAYLVEYSNDVVGVEEHSLTNVKALFR